MNSRRSYFCAAAGMAVVAAVALFPRTPTLATAAAPAGTSADPATKAFFEQHCVDCHDADAKKGGLDLSSLSPDLADAENFARWVKVHDYIASGEMPPKKEPRPAAGAAAAVTGHLRAALAAADRARFDAEGRTGVRRLTRAEYENTVRDLFDMPGITLAGELPADGTAHGFDNNSDALNISHVNMAKYVEAADRVLDVAVAKQPKPPTVHTQRVSLANKHGGVAHIILRGDGVLLKDKKPDPEVPPAGKQWHIDQGAHERMGSFLTGATVGLFRPEDESFFPYFNSFVAIYPARYRLRTSLWSFQWDKGQVLPSRGTEAARLAVIQITGGGSGGGHPTTAVLGYFDAPSLNAQQHEVVTWLNQNETIGFNFASVDRYEGNNTERAMGQNVPAIACDYLDVEGPIYDAWPPASHRVLFGDLPLVEFKPEAHPGVRPPPRRPVRQEMYTGVNQADPDAGLWTVRSDRPLEDADRLLAAFLPKAFRRPVADDVRRGYVARVDERLKAGDCFESAMRWAYRAALCSGDFLYRIEPAGTLDHYALAARLSYFFWNSGPDARLVELAAAGRLDQPDVLRGEVDRLMADPKAQRFVNDFVGQWLRLRQIAANDPDRNLYPEFTPYLQDSMVAETRAYFRELIDEDLGADHLVKSDFAMLNDKLAAHYGIAGVSGPQVRRVQLPPDSPRGPFLTQASVLKVTANGTTTSPVPRGAFVTDRLFGKPPEPPPPNTPAVEPDVRGATTIREQLDKHRADPSCAACHAKLDPPGFALEAFDPIGGFRDRYRSIGDGEPVPGRGYKLGPKVDPAGVLPDGRPFADVREFQALLAADRRMLLDNLARQFAVYSTGRPVAFADRDAIDAIVAATEAKGGGVRTLIHELTQSQLFQTR